MLGNPDTWAVNAYLLWRRLHIQEEASTHRLHPQFQGLLIKQLLSINNAAEEPKYEAPRTRSAPGHDRLQQAENMFMLHRYQNQVLELATIDSSFSPTFVVEIWFRV